MLDIPGQWYLDRPRGRLYYLGVPDEGMPKAEIIAAPLPHNRGPAVRGFGARGFPAATRLFGGAGRLRALGPVMRRFAPIFSRIAMRVRPTLAKEEI